VHAWATWQVYQLDRRAKGTGDLDFLASAYRAITLDVMWWLNQKDEANRGVFGGGFLGTGLSPLYAIPVGIVAAIPVITHEMLILNAETQLVACFAAFVITAYTQGGDAIAKNLDDKAAAVTAEHNAVEDANIAAVQAVIDAFDPATNKYTVTFVESGLSVVIAADKVRSMPRMAKRQASRANVLDAELAAQREQAKAMEAAQKAKQQLVAALKAAELAAILAVAEEEDRKIEREATKDRRAKVSFGAGNMGVSGYRSANKEPTPACAKPKVRPKTERKANPRDELEAAMTDLAVNA
jgi:hypothetical protein